MAWRNDVAWPRTVGQQVLVGVDQPLWKLGYETQVSTPRMYGTKRIYVFTGVVSRARLPERFALCRAVGLWKSQRCQCG